MASTAISTARGMSRFGCAVSSPRLAAVSKPVNSSTPYSTPNSTPPRPCGDEDGENALATSLCPPTLTIV